MTEIYRGGDPHSNVRRTLLADVALNYRHAVERLRTAADEYGRARAALGFWEGRLKEEAEKIDD